MAIVFNSDIRKIEDWQERDKAYRAKLHDPNYRDTLADRIEAGIELKGGEVDKLVDLLGKRCQARTKRRLRYALMACPHMENFGIFRRVVVTTGRPWKGPKYVAGQSCPDEIRTVRKCLIG
jgi:hypothetical protein